MSDTKTTFELTHRTEPVGKLTVQSLGVVNLVLLTMTDDTGSVATFIIPAPSVAPITDAMNEAASVCSLQERGMRGNG